MKDYPEGYCQHEISDLITDLLDQKYTTRVGSYLDNRLKRPEWARLYEAGRLKLNEQGMNQISTNEWPINTESIDKKFFSTKAPNLPVILEKLDCPNVHTVAFKDHDRLLLTLL